MSQPLSYDVLGSGPASSCCTAVAVKAAARYPDLVSRLVTVAGQATPALILASAADRFVDPAHSRELAAGIPDARVLDVAVGHLAIFEDYREILAALQEFLKRS